MPLTPNSLPQAHLILIIDIFSWEFSLDLGRHYYLVFVSSVATTVLLSIIIDVLSLYALGPGFEFACPSSVGVVPGVILFWVGSLFLLLCLVQLFNIII